VGNTKGKGPLAEESRQANLGRGRTPLVHLGTTEHHNGEKSALVGRASGRHMHYTETIHSDCTGAQR
jgi:hypothetical protein